MDTREEPSGAEPAPARSLSPVDVAVARLSRPVKWVHAFITQYAPWVSLALGVLSRVLSQHDIQFAPKAVALLLVAWTLPAIIARLLPDPAPGVTEPGWRRLIRTTGAPFVVVALYKNVLFFLVPIWFGAAHFPSLNMGMPILLAGMALLTCFTAPYQRHVTDHPARRVVWSAVVLFAALVPALAVLAFTSPRVSLFLSALIATAIATAALRGGDHFLSRRSVVRILWGAVPVGVLVVWAAPLLPPVPATCLDKGAGTGITNRNLTGRAEEFPRGTPRIHAWFAVSLPARYRQQVAYQWFRDGEKVGPPIITNITGGRAGGYRTATSKTNPGPGTWRAEIYNDSSQLIGRVSFRVLP